MRKKVLKIFTAFLVIASLTAGLTAVPVSAKSAAQTNNNVKTTDETNKAKTKTYAKEKKKALNALSARLKELRSSVYVYKNFGMTENYFTQRAKMFSSDETLVVEMNENWQEKPYSGSSCIRCEQKLITYSWGGWMMLNGYLPAAKSAPVINTGAMDGQGLDLTGAEELHFMARGEQGGEVVEFFVSGFGYDGSTDAKLVKYPDSTTKISLGWVELTREWKEYVIPLKGYDLSYVVCGFGYVLSDFTSGLGSKVFYLDDIYYSGNIKMAKNAPVLMRSYDTENKYIKNAAFSYDNALVGMAFISEGKKSEAKKIVDSFLYAINNDRAYLHVGLKGNSKRVRNAYASGNISPFPGWDSGTRLPGWYEKDAYTWFEDAYQCGSSGGVSSFVCMLFILYYQKYGGKKYLKAACSLMDWILQYCPNEVSYGFTGGFDGWEEAEPAQITKHTYCSLEQNLDIYSVANALWKITGKKKYRKAAKNVLKFIDSMYDSENGLFYTGTTSDGKTPDKSAIVLDAQVWSALALGDLYEPYEKALDIVSDMKTEEGGYPFCQSNVNGGWWSEGTAFTALMYRLRGDTAAYEKAMDTLITLQDKDGMFHAASVKNLSTGIYLFTGEPWLYSDEKHISPTAWFIMAANGFNPYKMTD